MVAIFLPTLGAGNAMLSGVPGCDVVGLLGAVVSTTLYVALFLAVVQLAPALFSPTPWRLAVLSVSGGWLVACVVLWILVKGWLFARYGLAAIRSITLLNQPGFELTYAYWETILNAAAVDLLQAAIFLCLLRIAFRVERAWVAAIVGVGLVSQLMLGEIGAGARRTILALAVIYLITRWWASADQRKLGKEIAFGLCLVAVFTVYYPYVRTNLNAPDIQARLTSGDLSATVLAGLSLFVPNEESVASGRVPIVREGPMELLCRVTEKQWARGQLTWGTVTGAALYMSIPSVFLANKASTNPDEIVAESYDLYPQQEFTIVDLATSPLAQLQSDFGPVGWFLAPVMYALVFMIFSSVFISTRFAALTRLLALGALWSVAASPEASLTAATSQLRDFVLFSVLIEILHRGYTELRPGFELAGLSRRD